MKIDQIKMGSLLSYLSLILGTVVSLVYTPIMIERLGQSEYGVYSIVLPMVSYLNLFSFGLGSAYTRFYTRYKEANDKYNMAKLNGMFLVIYSLLGVLVLIVGFTIAANPRLAFGQKLTEEEIELAVRLMYIMTVTAAVSFPLSVFESNTMVNERYIFLKLLAIVKSVINPLLIIPLLMIGLRSEAIAYMSLAFTLFSGLLNIIYCNKKLAIRFYFRDFDFKLLKSMFKFTGWVFVGIVVDQLNWSVDKLLLSQSKILLTELSVNKVRSEQTVQKLSYHLNGYYLAVYSIIVADKARRQSHRLIIAYSAAVSTYARTIQPGECGSKLCS